MTVVVGAPVAERAWILPKWFECLDKQTLKPDGFCFIYSDSQDNTHELLTNDIAPSYIRRVKLPFISRDVRNANPADPHSAKHMAKLRNELRRLFLSETDADYFVSLDTDILLEDKHILQELINVVKPGPIGHKFPIPPQYDVACARTVLHHWDQSQCYNAGMLGGGEGFDQVWQRCDNSALLYKSPIRIDVPMAIWATRRHVVGMCDYVEHECGEDIGFAQSLKQHNFRVAWRHDLVARHVWGPSFLESDTKVEAHAGMS